MKINGREFGREPPAYEDLPCTCSHRRALKTVKVMNPETGQEVDVQYYRDCAKNFAFLVWGRHFSQISAADPDFVAACKARVKEFFFNEFLPSLGGRRIPVNSRWYFDNVTLPAKRPQYLREWNAFVARPELKMVLKAFVKDNEAHAVTTG